MLQPRTADFEALGRHTDHLVQQIGARSLAALQALPRSTADTRILPRPHDCCREPQLKHLSVRTNLLPYTAPQIRIAGTDNIIIRTIGIDAPYVSLPGAGKPLQPDTSAESYTVVFLGEYSPLGYDRHAGYVRLASRSGTVDPLQAVDTEMSAVTYQNKLAAAGLIAYSLKAGLDIDAIGLDEAEELYDSWQEHIADQPHIMSAARPFYAAACM